MLIIAIYLFVSCVPIRFLLQEISRSCTSSTNSFPWALANFCMAQVVMGLGASPLYVLGPTYLWDNLYQSRQRLYAIYSAWIYVMAALGPAVGFLLGAAFLSIWIDIPLTPPAGSAAASLGSEAEDWLGAWWLGLLIFSAVQLAVAIPLLAFPKNLPNVVKKNQTSCEMVTESTISVKSQMPPTSNTELPEIRHLPAALKRLFLNPMWLIISLITVTEQNIATGFVTFISKYLQVSFNQPAARASIITGGVVIPAAVGGILLGAFLLRRFSLQPLRGATRLIVFLGLTTATFAVPMVFLHCAEITPPPVGLAATQYFTISGDPATQTEAVVRRKALEAAPCWRSCQCPSYLHQPVCASEITFLSACHAGCQLQNGFNNQSFSKCVCAGDWNATALSGKCSSEKSCPEFFAFLVLLFLLVFVTAVGQEPAHIITLSVVPRPETSFALGMQVSRCRQFLNAYSTNYVHFMMSQYSQSKKCCKSIVIDKYVNV